MPFSVATLLSHLVLYWSYSLWWPGFIQRTPATPPLRPVSGVFFLPYWYIKSVSGVLDYTKYRPQVHMCSFPIIKYLAYKWTGKPRLIFTCIILFDHVVVLVKILLQFSILLVKVSGSNKIRESTLRTLSHSTIWGRIIISMCMRFCVSYLKYKTHEVSDYTFSKGPQSCTALGPY